MPPMPLPAAIAQSAAALDQTGLASANGARVEGGAAGGTPRVAFPDVFRDQINNANKASKTIDNKQVGIGLTAPVQGQSGLSLPVVADAPGAEASGEHAGEAASGLPDFLGMTTFDEQEPALLGAELPVPPDGNALPMERQGLPADGLPRRVPVIGNDPLAEADAAATSSLAAQNPGMLQPPLAALILSSSADASPLGSRVQPPPVGAASADLPADARRGSTAGEAPDTLSQRPLTPETFPRSGFVRESSSASAVGISTGPQVGGGGLTPPALPNAGVMDAAGPSGQPQPQRLEADVSRRVSVGGPATGALPATVPAGTSKDSTGVAPAPTDAIPQGPAERGGALPRVQSAGQAFTAPPTVPGPVPQPEQVAAGVLLAPIGDTGARSILQGPAEPGVALPRLQFAGQAFTAPPTVPAPAPQPEQVAAGVVPAPIGDTGGRSARSGLGASLTVAPQPQPQPQLDSQVLSTPRGSVTSDVERPGSVVAMPAAGEGAEQSALAPAASLQTSLPSRFDKQPIGQAQSSSPTVSSRVTQSAGVVTEQPIPAPDATSLKPADAGTDPVLNSATTARSPVGGPATGGGTPDVAVAGSDRRIEQRPNGQVVSGEGSSGPAKPVVPGAATSATLIRPDTSVGFDAAGALPEAATPDTSAQPLRRPVVAADTPSAVAVGGLMAPPMGSPPATDISIPRGDLQGMGARALQAFSTRDGLASDLTIDPAPRQSAGGEAGFASALGQIGRTPEVAPPQIPGNLPVLLAAATGSLGEDLSQRILWLSSHNLRSAEIRLDPPELGPLQVQVQHHRDGTSVHFTTSSAAVKDVVEANLPRLRELLEGSGLSLVDVNVAQQQQRGAPGQREAFDSSASTSRGLLATLQQSEVTPSVRRSIGLVDDYA